jgi:hypothetical protein
MSSGLFPIRINLELCINLIHRRIPWTGDQLRAKASAYSQGNTKKKKSGYPYVGWDSNP